MGVETVNHIIPHQANGRMAELLTPFLDIEPDGVFVNAEHLGNTGSAPSGWLLPSCGRASNLGASALAWGRKRLSICSVGFIMFMGESVDENGVRRPTGQRNPAGRGRCVETYAQRVAVEKLTLSYVQEKYSVPLERTAAGKPQPFEYLRGSSEPDKGHGQVLGFDLVSGAGKIRERVGYMSQRLSLYGDLSVFENLRFRAQVYGSDRRVRSGRGRDI